MSALTIVFRANQDHDQICTENYGQGGHPKRANEKLGREFERANQKQGKDIKRTNQKPMTYREVIGRIR